MKKVVKELPIFKYIEDPIENEVIEKKDDNCECCGENRGYLITSRIYSTEDIEFICPWCVSSGDACKKFDGFFNEVSSDSNLLKTFEDELAFKTPGVPMFQEYLWPSHCGDGCQFQGSYDGEYDFEKIDKLYLKKFIEESGIEESDLEEYGQHFYIFKFQCLHCETLLLHFDPC